MNKKRLMVCLLVIGMIFVMAVPAGASNPDANWVVKIKDINIRPRNLTVQVGDTVRWRNSGELIHTTTSVTGEWDSGNLDPGETFEFTFDQAGTFIYTCTIHDFRARVIVGG